MNQVFMSGGFPAPDRATADDTPFYLPEISAAVSATIEATLRYRARLVFGGHPGFTPIVMRIARILDLAHLVTVYQSAYFLEDFPSELLALQRAGAELIITPAGSDVQAGALSSSLKIMRAEMLSRDFNVGVFVGGMEGVQVELTAFTEALPESPACLMVDPGGRAARLAGDHSAGHEDSLSFLNKVAGSRSTYALRGRAYLSLVSKALELGAIQRNGGHDD